MPLNIEVTQFPNGIGTVGDNSVLNGVALPLPVNGAVQVEDFVGGTDYSAAWTVTAIGGGVTPSFVLSSNGILRLTTGAVAGDGASVEADGGGNFVDAFVVQQGVPAWIAARVDLSDAIDSTFILGFVPAGSALAPTDGVYLISAAGSGDVDLIVENSGAAQESVNVATLSAGATGLVEVALYWDGEKASAQIAGGGNSLVPDSANIPTVGTNATLTAAAGAAGAITADADWIAFGGGR